MRLVMLGPPGSGKGTLARPLARHFGAVHIATGDLFRAEIAAGTPLGVLADRYIKFGDLVPDDVTNAMMREKLSAPEAENFVLDGFPRTREQAEALDEILIGLGRPIDAALLVDVPDDLIVERAVGRLICTHCGAIFHLEFKPPKLDGICDVCKGALTTRDDDKPSTVRHRLSIYYRTTGPVIEFYREQKKLKSVQGEGSPQENFENALATLGES